MIRRGFIGWALIAITLLPALALAQPRIEFDAEYFVTPAGAGGARDFVVGDWNGDGRDDLASVHSDGSLVRFIGLGAFRFGVTAPLSLDEPLRSIATGDLDADGIADLIVGGETQTFLLLGDGNNGFAVSAALPYPGWDVAVAAMDYDDDLDVVTSGSDRIWVLVLEDLAVVATDSIGVTVESLGVGDFDENGIFDVVADYSGGFGVWLNNGIGDLGGFRYWGDSGVDVECLAVGDANGDGHRDVVGVCSNPNDDSHAYLYGRGDGTFGFYSAMAAAGAGTMSERSGPPPETHHIPPGPHFVVFADLNQDGRDESITLRAEYGSELMGRRSPAGPAAAAGDFDQDGDLDIAVLSGSFVAVHPRDAGALRSRAIASLHYTPYRAALADLNQDGILDFVVRTDESFQTLRGTIDGGFEDYYPGAETYAPFALGDVDGDGYPDLVGLEGLFRSVGDGTFEPNAAWAFPFHPTALALGDLDGDGDLDIVFGNTPAGEIVVWHGDGAGAFAEHVRLPGATSSIDLADFDGDGRLDLAGRGADAFVRFGDAAGGFGPRVVLDAAGVSPYVVGDVDGDGRPDLVTRKNTIGLPTVVYLNRGTTFEAVEGGFQGYPAAIGDLDGDAYADLIGHHVDTNVWRGRGDGTFVLQSSFGPTGIPLLDDRNGDGTLDLLVARGDNVHGNQASISFYPNVTPALVTVPEHTFSSQGLQLLGVRPQPSRGAASVAFRLPSIGDVDVDVVDLQGRRVASRRWERLPAGNHVRALDLALAPGVYTVIARHAGVRRSTRAIVLR
jgi:hypothetical protein